MSICCSELGFWCFAEIQGYQVTKQPVLSFSYWVIWHVGYTSFSTHVTYNHFQRKGCSWLTNSFAKCHKQCLIQGFCVVFPCSLSIFTYTLFFPEFLKLISKSATFCRLSQSRWRFVVFFSQRLVKSHWLQRFNFLPLLREVISSVESALDISQSETNKS